MGEFAIHCRENDYKFARFVEVKIYIKRSRTVRYISVHIGCVTIRDFKFCDKLVFILRKFSRRENFGFIICWNILCFWNVYDKLISNLELEFLYVRFY